ncbi:MAG TPA: hypothetical protein VFK56_10830 [Mycobacterium sp.]|nr:hypothetical protein [Mycobacterium sp.]
MSGDVNNTAVWNEADVFIGDLAATNPTAGAAFTLNESSGGTAGTTTEWDFVGLLDGSAGFGEQESITSTDHSAWGYGVITTTKKDFKLTRTFTALEDNTTVLGLLYDATGVTFTGNNFSGDLKVRDNSRQFKVAFETRSGTEIKRYISAGHAMVESIGQVTEGEDGLQSRPVTVTIYPDSTKVLWHTYKGAAA